jgi:hypothetical protein
MIHLALYVAAFIFLAWCAVVLLFAVGAILHCLADSAKTASSGRQDHRDPWLPRKPPPPNRALHGPWLPLNRKRK